MLNESGSTRTVALSDASSRRRNMVVSVSESCVHAAGEPNTVADTNIGETAKDQFRDNVYTIVIAAIEAVATAYIHTRLTK